MYSITLSREEIDMITEFFQNKYQRKQIGKSAWV